MRSFGGLIVVAGAVLVATGAGVAAQGSADELTGLWSGTDSDVRESETNTASWEGEATIERRGDTYTLVYEITQFSQNFDHDSCSSTSIIKGEASTAPEENGQLVFVGVATTDITSDCKFHEKSGGKAQEVGERSTLGYLMEGDVIRLDLLPASYILMQPQIEPEEEWGVIVNEDGSVELISPPDGGVLSLTGADLPFSLIPLPLATVGSMVVNVGPPDTVIEGDPKVLLNGMPIARIGDGTAHGGEIVTGNTNVLVNGVPAAQISSFAICPQMTGVVPHVGGPITVGVLPTGFITNGVLVGDAEALLELYLRLADLPVEDYPEEMAATATEADSSAGDTVIEGDFDDYEVGDGVAIGDDPVDIGIVTEKGSIVLDRPLRHDHPAGSKVVRVDAELIEQASAEIDEVATGIDSAAATESESSTNATKSASESQSGGNGAPITLIVALAVGVLAVVAGGSLFIRHRSNAS